MSARARQGPKNCFHRASGNFGANFPGALRKVGDPARKGRSGRLVPLLLILERVDAANWNGWTFTKRKV